MPSIFISHSHADHRLANRLQKLLEDLTARKIEIKSSSDKSAIPTGVPWKKWIDDNIVECDLAIVLLTESSLRGRWVLWEAGAVAGVQYFRDAKAGSDGGSPETRDPGNTGRVRVLNFGMPSSEMGPFAGDQAKNGRDADDVAIFTREILEYFQPVLGNKFYGDGLMRNREEAVKFVSGAAADLRHTPVPPSEALVQTWLTRIDEKMAEQDYRWVAAARRWINIAFLGIGAADRDEAIDFRIHIRLAQAFSSLEDGTAAALTQLELAQSLSPNDMMVLREIGQYCRKRDPERLDDVLEEMNRLDPDVFKSDREAIALQVGRLVDLEDYAAAHRVLDEADNRVVARDTYLLNWRALATFEAEGLAAARPAFSKLKERIGTPAANFWDEATLASSLIALGEAEAAQASLERLRAYQQSPAENRSAAKYFDKLAKAAGMDLNWRSYLKVPDDD